MVLGPSSAFTALQSQEVDFAQWHSHRALLWETIPAKDVPTCTGTSSPKTCIRIRQVNCPFAKCVKKLPHQSTAKVLHTLNGFSGPTEEVVTHQAAYLVSGSGQHTTTMSTSNISLTTQRLVCRNGFHQTGEERYWLGVSIPTQYGRCLVAWTEHIFKCGQVWCTLQIRRAHRVTR